VCMSVDDAVCAAYLCVTPCFVYLPQVTERYHTQSYSAYSALTCSTGFHDKNQFAYRFVVLLAGSGNIVATVIW